MTNEELQELCAALNEQLKDTRHELNQLRAWADRMPNPDLRYGGFTSEFSGRLMAIEAWMQQRPETPRNALRTNA